VGAALDVVIVGGGLAGSATAWAATQRGLSVVLLEQFTPGHDRGSSHGSARIVRRAYGDLLYTQLTGRAFELWSELERASGQRILRLPGGLDFGEDRDVPAVADRLAQAGVPHEVLDPGDAQRRWPGMRFAGPVVYHPQAGTMDPVAAITAFTELASRGGADVRYRAAAAAIRPTAAGATVDCVDGSSVTASCAVVAAGGWLGPLMAGQAELPPLRVTQQQIFHFPRYDPAAPPWPSVIHQGDGVEIYHLAGGRDGGPGDDRKIGEHGHGTVATAAGRDGRVDPRSRDRVVDYVRDWLPGLEPVPRTESTCLYTTTPSEDFVLDRVGPIVVCSPCSGHGAKFAPLIGELVTGLVTGDGDVPERFRLRSHASGRVGSVSL
jgi:monomeric sarcosine oxidase